MLPTIEENERTIPRSSGDEDRGTPAKPDGSESGEAGATTTENGTDRHPKPSRRAFIKGGALAIGAVAFSGRVSATEHTDNHQRVDSRFGGPQRGIDDQTREIDSCTEITEPGRYVLTRDLDGSSRGTCLIISADDVLLDGAGHTIAGGRSSGTGIAVGEYLGQGFSNVTIRNLRITEFRSVGIDHGGTNGGRIHNVTVDQCRIGLRFQEARNISIGGNEISNNGRGIVVTEASFGNAFRSNTVSDNGGPGIALFDASTDTQVVGNTVTDNDGSGVIVSEGSDGSRLTDNVVTGNAGHGFDVAEVTDVGLHRNLVQSNGGNGIHLILADADVQNTTIIDNEHGIHADLMGGVTASNIEVGNNDVGIYSGQDSSGAIDVQWSVIAGNDIGADSPSQRDNVHLTNNYWGAADGPSSAGDEPVADPVTGTLANGSGDAIAGFDGVAMARFDPWLVIPALSDAFAGPPRDLDGDGLYEDVNGDGDVNVGDAQALFAFEDSTTVQENAALFDFNEDGAVDVGDAQALFARLTGGNG